MAIRPFLPGHATGGAGGLRHRVTFAARVLTSDGYGGTKGDWQDQFTRPAAIEPRFGGEEIAAARLASRQPVTITVRANLATRGITAEWKATDERGTVYAIRTIIDPTGRNRYLEMLAEAGVEP